MNINDFLDIIRTDLDTFLVKWENHNKVKPLIYPLTQDNFSEWWEHFVIFVEQEENVDDN